MLCPEPFLPPPFPSRRSARVSPGKGARHRRSCGRGRFFPSGSRSLGKAQHHPDGFVERAGPGGSRIRGAGARPSPLGDPARQRLAAAGTGAAEKTGITPRFPCWERRAPAHRGPGGCSRLWNLIPPGISSPLRTGPGFVKRGKRSGRLWRGGAGARLARRQHLGVSPPRRGGGSPELAGPAGPVRCPGQPPQAPVPALHAWEAPGKGAGRCSRGTAIPPGVPGARGRVGRAGHGGTELVPARCDSDRTRERPELGQGGSGWNFGKGSPRRGGSDRAPQGMVAVPELPELRECLENAPRVGFWDCSVQGQEMPEP